MSSSPMRPCAAAVAWNWSRWRLNSVSLVRVAASRLTLADTPVPVVPAVTPAETPVLPVALARLSPIMRSSRLSIAW